MDIHDLPWGPFINYVNREGRLKLYRAYLTHANWVEGGSENCDLCIT